MGFIARAVRSVDSWREEDSPFYCRGLAARNRRRLTPCCSLYLSFFIL